MNQLTIGEDAQLGVHGLAGVDQGGQRVVLTLAHLGGGVQALDVSFHLSLFTA